MSLIPYALARPFLFGLDAETAHELTLDALARTQRTPLAWAYCTTMVEDPVALAGLHFPNRVGLAAGLANKVLAYRLGLSVRTVEMHRANMMTRLGVRSLPEALRLGYLAGAVSVDGFDGTDTP